MHPWDSERKHNPDHVGLGLHFNLNRLQGHTTLDNKETLPLRTRTHNP